MKKNMLPDNTVNSLCNLTKGDSVAFDFDGTLINCKIRQVEVLRSILRRKEYNILLFDFNKWWKFKTNGSNTFDALIKMNVSSDIAKDITKSWIDIIEKPEWLDLDKLNDNVISLLRQLKNSNKPIFIVTARKSEYSFLNQIRKLSIDQYITKYFVVHPFHSKEQKKEILDYLKPSLFVGDTENDFYSAKKSGVQFIAVSSGQRSKQFLISKGINSIVDNISMLKTTKMI